MVPACRPAGPQAQRRRTAESAALLEATFADTIAAAARYAEEEDQVDQDPDPEAADTLLPDAFSSSLQTPHDYELAERRRPLFEPDEPDGRRPRADRPWTDTEDRAVLQHFQAHGFSADAFRHLSARVLTGRNPESVRQRFRRLMRSYLAARGADYAGADFDDLSDYCEEA